MAKPTFMTKEWCMAAAEHEAYVDSLTRAKSALENWGRHHPWCASLAPGIEPCTCGLAHAIAAADPNAASPAPPPDTEPLRARDTEQSEADWGNTAAPLPVEARTPVGAATVPDTAQFEEALKECCIQYLLFSIQPLAEESTPPWREERRLNDFRAARKAVLDLFSAARSRSTAPQELEQWREREAAVCPEDVPFDEYIRTLEKQRDHWRREARDYQETAALLRRELAALSAGGADKAAKSARQCALTMAERLSEGQPVANAIRDAERFLATHAALPHPDSVRLDWLSEAGCIEISHNRAGTREWHTVDRGDEQLGEGATLRTAIDAALSALPANTTPAGGVER